MAGVAALRRASWALVFLHSMHFESCVVVVTDEDLVYVQDSCEQWPHGACNVQQKVRCTCACTPMHACT